MSVPKSYWPVVALFWLSLAPLLAVEISPGEKEAIEILYSPPGASCIPTPMLLVPY